ncbi:MAG: amidohydrolase family protein [Pirellulales bacterium]|nr:amidohydrolase family protein [Pirellulales bacterium]
MLKRLIFCLIGAVALSLICTGATRCEELKKDQGADIRMLKLRDWQPRSMLKTKVTKVDRPKFTAIDAHNHLGGGAKLLTSQRVARYLAEMDAAGVETVVNLDGGWGQRLRETLAALDEAHPGRFLTFALINFRGIDDPDWGEREAKRLEESFKAGAKGLKFHKSLGLTVRYQDGRLMPVDDPKLDAVWEMCAKYDRPVMIHSSDPAAFFTPLDRYNERWHELNEHPGWLFHGEKYPSREEILAQRNRMIAKHPKTTYLCAHMGNNPEDLAELGRWLDAYPNMYVDIDARISELGRQPYTARRFFLKYQDRILYGTDTTPRREAFRINYRFLETDDEYFDCRESHHLQGFWMIYGVFLPDDVLKKVYRDNALKILYFGPDGKPDARESAGKTAALKKDYRVPKAGDFKVTGRGDNPAWDKTPWCRLDLRGRGKNDPRVSRFKMLYSDSGLYVLMDAEDRALSVSEKTDFDNLWTEDVLEFFLWPDQRWPVYFEYEISPLGRELALLVPNFGGHAKQYGWRPWHYEGERKTRKAVAFRSDGPHSGAKLSGWTAEVFVPYALLKPLQNVPPAPGTKWRANLYRCDYDGGRQVAWSWSPTGSSFHDLDRFATLVFE